MINFIKDRRLLILINFLYFWSFLFLGIGQFKLVFVLSFLVFLINFFISRDLFISLFYPFVISLFFYFPAKIFNQLVIESSDLESIFYEDGLLANFGLNISDFLMLAIMILLFRKFVFSKKIFKFKNHWNKNKIFWLYSFAFLSFSVYSILSSLYISWFSFYSLILSIQSLKILLVFVSFYYFFGTYRKSETNNFYYLLILILVSQNIMGFWQVFTSTHNPISPYENFVPEENLTLIRPYGIIGHANPNALILTLLYVLVAKFSLKKDKKLFIAITLITFLSMALTQSRTAWLSWFLFFLLMFFLNRKKIINFVKLNFSIKLLSYSILLLLVFSALVYQRLNLSYLFFSETGGGPFRIKLIKEAWGTFLYSPFYGYGIGNSIAPILRFYPDGYVKSFPFPVHFAYLQIFLEGGLFGFITFFLPWVVWSGRLLMEKNIFLLGLISLLCYYALQPSNFHNIEIYLLAMMIGKYEATKKVF